MPGLLLTIFWFTRLEESFISKGVAVLIGALKMRVEFEYSGQYFKDNSNWCSVFSSQMDWFSFTSWLILNADGLQLSQSRDWTVISDASSYINMTSTSVTHVNVTVDIVPSSWNTKQNDAYNFDSEIHFGLQTSIFQVNSLKRLGQTRAVYSNKRHIHCLRRIQYRLASAIRSLASTDLIDVGRALPRIRITFNSGPLFYYFSLLCSLIFSIIGACSWDFFCWWCF